MKWDNFNTYRDSKQNAFETLCNQLFERYLKRTYSKDLINFRVINGAGGDGGIEAYGEIKNKGIVAIQSKWFRQSLNNSQINQIKKSILTALNLRPQIKEYIICIPHNVSSLKFGKGKTPTTDDEENKINKFKVEINNTHPNLILTWWFENEIQSQLQNKDNEGVHKFWFENEVITLTSLLDRFALQKEGWLKERYISELHGQGEINKEYQKICFTLQYRNELLNQVTNVIDDLTFCISLIKKFIVTNSNEEINNELIVIKENLSKFENEFQKIDEAIKTENEYFKPTTFDEIKISRTKLELQKMKPNNIQKNILSKLISSLNKIEKYNLPNKIQEFTIDFKQKIRLVLGEAGTGKTHGLSKCVEFHLENNSPALIIQAKGSPYNNWTKILSTALENHWNKDEILSALESLAIKNDVSNKTVLKTGEELNNQTKALIFVDGLEEEIGHENEWYERIRECKPLTEKYPRVRFIFSARSYFYKENEFLRNDAPKVLHLPREGDVSIEKVAPSYFQKYNIQLSSLELIRGIDSLLALRLFCNEYKNKTINSTENIVTATSKLINIKIDNLENDFSKNIIRIGKERYPINDSLRIIANCFFQKSEVEHNELFNKISPELNIYLNGTEIDNLIDYLADNAILIKNKREDKVLKKPITYYNITYQPLIEHIISENIYYNIKNGSLKSIPELYINNEQIIQNIINNLLVETDKLIGENNFLTEGFDEWEIKKYQLIAISKAPVLVAKRFKDKIDNLFINGYKNLNYVLEYLILPSSFIPDSFFGAEYLHQTLKKFTVFERDKIWSGLDSFEKKKQINDKEFKSISNVFINLGLGNTNLLENQHHNQRPLIFAWGLSNIDQGLRNNLRVSLTDWAIKNPHEFLLLLKKMFNCNDPQIQEDLGSIMLGVASKLKDKEKIKELALWSNEHIFNQLNVHRNIIVRYGFRSIVERAFQYGVISKDEVEKCKPKPMQKIDLLPIADDLNFTGNEHECYPIVHDLAWYVIQNAYRNFIDDHYIDEENNDFTEAKKLLSEYNYKFNNNNSSNIYYWTMAVAIAYIKNLGFTRNEGNCFTEETHGSKSQIFTYEEKYTWLAVHYIQGYLSDYIPVKTESEGRKFITDYSQITDIPNPAESLTEINSSFEKNKINENWIIKEILSKEFEKENDLKKNISYWVDEEPVFDVEKWLCFDSADFEIDEINREWIALYNNSILHDSKQICYTNFYAVACLVKKNDLQSLITNIKNYSNPNHPKIDIKYLHSSPRTHTYCNPSDVVWMTWIEEDQTENNFYDFSSNNTKKIYNCITEVTQNNINAENRVTLPSKKLRELINCYELEGNELKDSNGKTIAFYNKVSDLSDSQELVLVDKKILEDLVDKEGYEIVWFIELFKNKNHQNKNLDINYVKQKTRKYFVWTEKNEKKRIKFWDAWYSN